MRWPKLKLIVTNCLKSPTDWSLGQTITPPLMMVGSIFVFWKICELLAGIRMRRQDSLALKFCKFFVNSCLRLDWDEISCELRTPGRYFVKGWELRDRLKTTLNFSHQGARQNSVKRAPKETARVPRVSNLTIMNIGAHLRAHLLLPCTNQLLMFMVLIYGSQAFRRCATHQHRRNIDA